MSEPIAVVCPLPERLGDRSMARLEFADGTTRIVTRSELEQSYPHLLAVMDPHRR